MKPSAKGDPTASCEQPHEPPTGTTAITADALEAEAHACAGVGLDTQHFERALFAGAREFLARPGKAFRARLVETSFALAGGDLQQLPTAALEAIELLHAGSLIVDDIQDNADERRGAPALHRIVGMPRALNVGNWLYFVALSKLDELALDPLRTLETHRAAHRCFLRCHEGQALDLTLAIGELKRAEVGSVARTTSQLKTGALMSFAARLGALVADAAPADAETLAQFGEQAGVALQMLDDLGAFVATARQEKALEDLRGQRVNWVWAWAVEGLDEVTYRQLAKQTARGENLLEVRQRLAQAVEPLGRERSRGSLRAALHGLEQALFCSRAEPPASTAQRSAFLGLSAELARLEQSYG